MELFVSPTVLEAPFLDSRSEAAFAFRGRRGLEGPGWRWLELGVGKVNAAMTLAAYLEAHPEVRRVLLFGLAGAYPGTGLRLGDLVLASEEIQADLGTRRGMRPLGFPALEVRGARYYERFPADPAYTRELAGRLGLRPMPLLTADRVAEGLDEAHERRRQWAAVAESMEGAALAQAALWFGRPWAELRAISNLAGERRKERWDIDAALAALARAFVRLLG